MRLEKFSLIFVLFFFEALQGLRKLVQALSSYHHLLVFVYSIVFSLFVLFDFFLNSAQNIEIDSRSNLFVLLYLFFYLLLEPISS